MNINHQHLSHPYTVLITGARSPVALEWSRLFHANGCRVVAVDSMPATLCGSSRAVSVYYRVPEPNQGRDLYIDALAQIMHKEQVDLLWPTCEEVFHVAAGKERLTECGKVFAESLEHLDDLHNKWKFIDKVRQWGWNAPESWLFQDEAQLQQFCSQQDAGEFIIKPVYSRFASRVAVWSGRPVAFRRGDISPRKPWMVQRRIRGRTYCTYSVAIGGRLLAHCAYAADFTAGRGATVAFEAEEMPELLDWVAAFAAKERFTGQLAFDFIMTREGDIFPLECNPRATSGIHLFRPEDGLASALIDGIAAAGSGLSGKARPLITVSPGRCAIIAPAMMLYGLAGVRSLDRFKRWLSYMRLGRDAVFRLRDPWPGMEQARTLFYFWRIARSRNVSLMEATTLDIEWNGEL